MFDRIRRGWTLVQASWSVLRQDREILFLPILSALSAIFVLAAVFFGLYWDDISAHVDPGKPGPGSYVVFALTAYVLNYLAIFFNVAMMCAADERMEGGDPTLRGALSEARAYLGVIAVWALVAMVVSTILKAIEDHGGLVGEIISRILGFAWALMTYLVVPVMVIEGSGTREAMGRSKDLVKRTWGETVSGDVGMSIIGVLAIIPAVLVGMMAVASGQAMTAILGLAVAIGWGAFVVVALSAMNAVFRVALYRFATDGETPAGFGGIDLHDVFPPKRGRRARGR